MKLLLDTHIWIWAVSRPEKLSRAVKREIDNPRNELFLSPISIWEAHRLHRRGKLGLKGSFQLGLAGLLAQLPVKEAPFDFLIAAESSRIQLPQPDVGDTLLAATASVLGLTLVTADAQLLKCGWLKTLANR
jgi:PIN domain nuclease of toxin-antitoxin system